jgi:hypothetical protein
MSDITDKLNKAFQAVFERLQDEGAIPRMPFSLLDPDKRKHFPGGLRWRYFSAMSGHRKFLFCWSITRNANNKFVSWVYMPKGKRWVMRSFVEHRKKYKAKERAERLLKQREEKISKKKERVPMVREGMKNSNEEPYKMSKGKKSNGKKVEEPIEVKQEKPKAEQTIRREALFTKYEKQIREHFSKEGSKVSELKKALGLKDEKSYIDLLWCRDKLIAEKK